MIHKFKHGFLQAETIQRPKCKQSRRCKTHLDTDKLIFQLSSCSFRLVLQALILIDFGMSPYSANCIMNSDKREEKGNVVCYEGRSSARTCLFLD